MDLYDDIDQSRNAHVLGCLRLDGDGLPVAGQRLAFDAVAGRDVLTPALAADPRIAPFLVIPSKDNGLDIEGIAARGERLLVGLRGPVLRGIALVLDLRLAGLGGDGPTLTLDGLRYRYLQLSGLAVRDLAVVPGSDDVLVLAGPTMDLAGPCYLYRWRNELAPEETSPTLGVTLEETEPMLWIRDGRPGRPKDGSDKPEGLDVQRLEGRLLAWVAYDDPTGARWEGLGTRFSPMPFSTADISIQLLMDTTTTLQEIESRMTARAFGAVHNPEKGPEVRLVLEELLEVLDRTSPDGDI